MAAFIPGFGQDQMVEGKPHPEDSGRMTTNTSIQYPIHAIPSRQSVAQHAERMSYTAAALRGLREAGAAVGRRVRRSWRDGERMDAELARRREEARLFFSAQAGGRW
jgi:hypothetical protein